MSVCVYVCVCEPINVSPWPGASSPGYQNLQTCKANLKHGFIQATFGNLSRPGCRCSLRSLDLLWSSLPSAQDLKALRLRHHEVASSSCFLILQNLARESAAVR